MANRFLLLVYRAVPLFGQCPEPVTFRYQVFSLLKGADILPVIRGGRRKSFADDLPDIREVCLGRTSGASTPTVSTGFAYFSQGDKSADNSVIADLPRPVPAADKTLG